MAPCTRSFSLPRWHSSCQFFCFRFEHCLHGWLPSHWVISVSCRVYTVILNSNLLPQDLTPPTSAAICSEFFHLVSTTLFERSTAPRSFLMNSVIRTVLEFYFQWFLEFGVWSARNQGGYICLPLSLAQNVCRLLGIRQRVPITTLFVRRDLIVIYCMLLRLNWIILQPAILLN